MFFLKIIYPTLANFTAVFDAPYSLGQKLFNSSIAAFFTVMIAIPIATMAAYAFSRLMSRQNHNVGGDFGDTISACRDYYSAVFCDVS